MNNSNNSDNYELLLVNILNTMYNDNLRQIYNLQDSNSQIRRLLVEILNRRQETPAYRVPRLSPNLNTHTYAVNLQPTPNTAFTSVNLARESVRRPVERTRQVIQPLRNARETAEITSNRWNYYNNILNNFNNSFFDPIEVYPTQTQIENATRIVLYRDILQPNNQSCPISLTPFNDEDNVMIIRYCSHIFHREELTQWFRTNCRCPVCRYDIRNYQNPSQNNRSTNIPLEPQLHGRTQVQPQVERQRQEEYDNQSEEDIPDLIEESEAEAEAEPEQQILIDNSNNLINTLSSILLNSFLNNYSGSSNSFEPFFLDITFDTSYNYTESPNLETRINNLQYRRSQ
jgi:hypothetical protein